MPGFLSRWSAARGTARSPLTGSMLSLMDGNAPTEISAAHARELVAADAVLLDVREDHEWVAGHAPEAAHMPMSQIAERVAELPADKTIVCVCHVGARSAMVAAALNRAGWKALNLTGGMEAWAAAGLPVVDTEGRAGQII
jgi:rhodanese-related sulfurtransferase